MGPRSVWKGHLKLAHVSCAVSLYGATTDNERTAFHKVNGKTGNRVRQQLVDEVTNEVVDREDLRRGFEIAPGEHVVMEDAELEAIRIESSRTIDIERFVPANAIDPIYVDSQFYLAPNDEIASDAFALIRDAMKARSVVGLGKVAMNGRERLMVLTPRGRGMLASGLRYPYEIRSDAEIFDAIPETDLPKEILALADDLVRARTKKFRPERFEDRYEAALLELIKSRRLGAATKRKKIRQASTGPGSLAEELRRSLEDAG